MVDTGGWEPDAKDRAAAIAAQAETAVVTADVVLFVVDAMVGSTDVDEAAVKMLRRSAKPVILVANKADNTAIEMEATSLWSLGLGEPFPVSALHGRGSGDLLDAILAALPEAPAIVENRPRGPRRVALVGRPNVGKSSLLNRFSGEERAVVDSVAGTTVDPVDSLVEIGGETWQLVDTAGLRKRVGKASGTEYYASLRTAGAIEAAEVAVVLLDSSEPISEQDQRILSMVDRGRPGAGHRVQQVGPGRRRPSVLPGQGDRPGAAPHPLGDPAEPVGDDRPGRGQAGPGPAQGAGQLGDPGADRAAQPVADRAGAGHPAPGARWAGAADPVRDAGRRGAAAVRALHHRPAGRRLPALRRAQAPRGVRVRGQPDRDLGHARARSSAPAAEARRTADAVQFCRNAGWAALAHPAFRYPTPPS